MEDDNRPKRSKKRIESGIHGKHYERKVLSLIALKCLLDEDIEDFWILSNPQEVEKFDDIIIFTQHHNGDEKLFMIQIKHRKEKTKRPMVAETLDAPGSKLGLKAYEKAFSEIKENKEFLDMHAVSSEIEMFFILFNNCNVNRGKETENVGFSSTEPFRFINTSSNPESVLKITNKTGTYVEAFIDRFYFYTEQIEHKAITDEIASLLGINDENIQVMLNFFSTWVDSNDKYCTKLWKLDVKMKLLEIIIGDYVPPRSSQSISESILNNIISKFDVTVIAQESSSISVWNEIFRKIKRFYKHLTTAWDERVPNDIEDKLYLPVKNCGTFSINSGTITKRLIYVFMVTQRKVPFFIKTTNRLFESFKSKLQRALDIYSVIFNVNQTELNFVNVTKVFQNFTDVEEELYKKYSKKLQVSFQGKAGIDLYSLTNNYSKVKQQISVDDYIDLLQKRCMIGKPNELPPYYINRKMRVPVLKQEVLRENGFVFFIFKCTKPTKIKYYESIDLDQYESIQEDDEILGKYYIITTPHEFDNHYLERIECLSNNQIYCLLKYINKNYFLLIHANGPIDALRTHLTYIRKKDTELTNIFKNCKINVVCNNAGMGKSMFLNFINTTFSSDEWVIHIDLKKFRSSIKKLKTIDDLISFSYNCQNEDVKESFHCFLEPLYKNLQHKIIWLIDDYEEVNHDNDLLELFELASKQGFRIWIVARPYLKLEFENTFHVFSMELKEFNKINQIMFIKKYLKQQNKNEDDIENIIAATDDIRNLLEDSFIGTCQQTMMLTEILLKYEDKLKQPQWHIHDIYEKFMTLNVNDNVYIRTISKLALKVFFTDNALEKVFDLEEFNEDVHTFQINYPKDSFITEFGENNIPIFSHRTYAEFLTARWLFHTMKKQLKGQTPFNISDILEMLFLKELTGIRLFLDNMLTEHLPLHSAIINKEEEKILNFINQPSYFIETDLLGRSVFHLLSSYGSYYDIGITLRNKHFVRNLDVHSEIVRNGKEILLRPLESLKPVEPIAKIQQYLPKFLSLDDIMQIFREDALNKWSSTDYALLSGSLLELDALLDLRDSVTTSPLPLTEERTYCLLFHCIQNNYKNILARLDVKGLNNIKIGDSKMSLLHLAITSKNLEAVKKLTTEHHLDEWGVDDKGNTPLHIACDHGDDSLLKYFFDQVDIDLNFLEKKNMKGHSHLHILARRGHEKWIERIIRNFPEIDIDSVCCNGNTPFIMSVIFNNPRVAIKLQSYGANVKHSNKKNMTALHFAASKGFNKSVEKLLEWGAGVDQKDDFGITPLIKASTWGHKRIVLLLLKNKANVNLFDKIKRTALHHAVRRNRIATVVLLLKYEANVNCVNKMKESPLIIACKYNFPNIVKLLFTRDITYGKQEALEISIKKKHSACLDVLFQEGVTRL